MFGWWGKKYKRNLDKSLLENLSAEFSYVFGEKLQWQWDDRFHAVLAQIDSSQKEKVIGILESYFSDYWNVLCSEDLPMAVQKLILQFDGMNPEQLLFSTDTREAGFLYCAWWPWQDGENISIRIALHLDDLNEAAKLERVEALKQGFGLAA